MKKGILFVAAVVCMAGFAWFGSRGFAKEPSGPKMVIPERSFDFKNVKEGDILRHTFRVYNKGSDTLIIQKVTPG